MDNQAEAARRVLNYKKDGLGLGSPGPTALTIIPNIMIWITAFLLPYDRRATMVAMAGIWSGMLAMGLLWQLVIRSRWNAVSQLIDWEKVELLARQSTKAAVR